MGVYVKTVHEYNQLWEKSFNRIDPVTMETWFGQKVAEEKDFMKMKFDKKTAIVVIGPSGIGKTYAATDFMSRNPSFKFISYDDCHAEAMSILKKDDKDTAEKCWEIVERQLRKNQRNNIILDGNFLHPITRAAVFKVLREVYGYEIHVIYYTFDYVVEYMPERILSRAVQMFLYRKSLNACNKGIYELYEKSKKVLEAEAERLGKTENEVILQYAENPIVNVIMQEIINNFQIEMEDNAVRLQEECGYFAYGADYIYKI